MQRSNGMISDESFDIAWFGFAHHAEPVEAQDSSRGSASSPSPEYLDSARYSSRVLSRDEPSRARSREATSRDERFPGNERLLKTKDFRRVYEKGVSFKKDAFVLYAIPNASGKNRIGISIGSAKIALAARRNRLKRLFREAYRMRKKYMAKGFDMVVVVRRDIKRGISYKEVDGIFVDLARKAGIVV